MNMLNSTLKKLIKVFISNTEQMAPQIPKDERAIYISKITNEVLKKYEKTFVDLARFDKGEKIFND